MLKKMFNSSVKHGVLGTNQKRTYDYVMAKCMEELGELSVEVQIENGLSYKTKGKDGIQGEAVDLAISAMDMFALTCGSMSKHEMAELFEQIMSKKLEKWHEKSGVESDKFCEMVNGVKHSFNSNDNSYGIDRVSTWFKPENIDAEHLTKDAGYMLDQSNLEDFIGGSKHSTYVYIDDIESARKVFHEWQAAISRKISLSSFHMSSDAPFLFLHKHNDKGIIYSQLDPRPIVNTKKVYEFKNGYSLNDVILAVVAENTKLKSIKMWDDEQEDFYSEIDSWNGGITTKVVMTKCTDGFTPSIDDLYDIANSAVNLPHFETWTIGEFFIDLFERYEYCNQTKNGERGFYKEINMECEVQGCFKQYNLEVVQGTSVLTSYGKIDSEVLTSQKRKFNTVEEAYAYINTKSAEKLRSGYSIVSVDAVK